MYRWYHTIFSPIYPYLISVEDEIVWACDRYSNETMTLEKNVTKYKHLRKWMVEVLSKSESRGIKIAQVNSIRITKLSIFFIILRAVLICEVIKRTRFLTRPPAIVKTIEQPIIFIKHRSKPIFTWVNKLNSIHR